MGAASGHNRAMAQKRLLLVGGLGLVGRGLLDTLDRDPSWDVVAVSRRSPDFESRATFVSVDLVDRERCEKVFGEAGRFTHIVYAALYERENLVAGWREDEQIRTNVGMLTNVLDFVTPTEHFSLLQGTKAYGAHLRPMTNPGKEHHPRPPGPNFYWPHEDLVRSRAADAGFGFTIFRPQIICGVALGSPMNMTAAIAALAALQQARGQPLHFPGGATSITQATDAELLGRAIRWASENESTWGETFNITNGDELVWRSVWPSIADAFGLKVGDDEPASLTQSMSARADEWEAIRERHHLRYSLDELVGQSWQFADAVFAGGPPTLLSTIKARQFGFADCIDTEEMFRRQFDALRRLRWIP